MNSHDLTRFISAGSQGLGSEMQGDLPRDANSVSLSHWGMFEVAPPRFVVPAGLFSDSDRAEWSRPGGYIEIAPADRWQIWWVR